MPAGPYKIVLASRSPRRRELLEACGVEFSTIDYDVDESFSEGMPPEIVPGLLAIRKALAYPGELPAGTVLIAADTCVICGEVILGKPADAREAHRMLKMLSGRTHQVTTGVAIRKGEQMNIFSETTLVEFNRLSGAQIAYYVEQYEPFDKAGAYGIQEWIGLVGIKRVEGDFYNVMGLPVNELYRRLRKMKVLPPLFDGFPFKL